MAKLITVKICGCAIINDPCVTESTIIEAIHYALCKIEDITILYKEECVIIQMWDCSENHLAALKFLKEMLYADYVILY